MSEWQAEVVKIEEIKNHPNADKLEIAVVLGDYPVIVRKGEYKVGDLASYIPIDTILDKNKPVFDFLNNNRIRAKRLRGIYSQGLLVEAPNGFKEGDSVVEFFELKKHVYPEEAYDLSLLPKEEQEKFYFPDRTIITKGYSGNNEKPPKGWSPPYYDLDSVRKYGKYFVDCEEVVITEKLDGENLFIRYDGDKVYVKSRNHFKKEDPTDRWWGPVLRLGLNDKVKSRKDLGFFGEVYGRVRPFFYDCKLNGSSVEPNIRMFDIFNFKTGMFLDYDDMVKVANELEIALAPELYRGPWKKDKSLYALAEKDSLLKPTIKKATRIMEGFVVRPVKERVDKFGRMVLKLKSERYNLTKK